MKVLFVTTSYPRYENDPLPAGNFVHRLAIELLNRGVEVVVVAPHSRGLPEHYFLENVEVYRVKYFFESLEKLTNVPGGLPQILARKSPYAALIPFMLGAMGVKIVRLIRDVDLVHVHWVFNAIPVALVKLIVNKPVLVTVHGSDARLLQVLPGKSLVRKMADIFVTVNRDQISILKDKLGDRVIHIPNGVEDNFSPLPPPPIVIGTTGHFVQVKNFPALARALKILYEEGVEFRAMFIGDGDDRKKIEAIVKDFMDRVIITGYIPNREVLAKLRELHIFVLPSFSEGRSIALLEAMATGRAIVASRIPQNMELIRDGENGLLFDPDSPEELAEKLKMLIRDEQLLIKMAKRSYNTIKELGLTWDRTAERYIAVYEELLKGGS